MSGNNLYELKEQYRKLGEEILRLESVLPEPLFLTDGNGGFSISVKPSYCIGLLCYEIQHRGKNANGSFNADDFSQLAKFATTCADTLRSRCGH